MIKVGRRRPSEEEYTDQDSRSILIMIQHRKCNWNGHILRHKGLLHDIIDKKLFTKLLIAAKQNYYTIIENKNYIQLKDSALSMQISVGRKSVKTD